MPMSKEGVWTQEELRLWVENEKIPQELLEPSQEKELQEFLSKNIDSLRSPVPPETENAYELFIVDKRTGKLVKVVNNIEEFQVCDGVSLPISASEWKEWERETAHAKKLTKGQKEELALLLSQIRKDRPLTKHEISKIIDEIRKPKKSPKYRQAGHLVDEKLKYQGANSSDSLFDLLSDETKQKIRESKIEVKAEGIRLTPPENKLIHALNLVLHEKSQNRNTKSGDFYSGNASPLTVKYGGTKHVAPVIKFKPSQLYKSYLGHSNYSSHDIDFINNTLQHLGEKKFLIKHDRIKTVVKGNKEEILTDRIECFDHLIKIMSIIPNLTEEEKNRMNKGDLSIRELKGEIIIALHPIFTDQIDTKFIEFPADTNRRLVIAAGGHKRVTCSMITLMEWMLREISNKRYKAEINEEKFPFILGLDKYVKQKRKKLLKERVTKDIEAIINMGIILKVDQVKNAQGKSKWIFYLNKDYE